jgi:hypothetical protein
MHIFCFHNFRVPEKWYKRKRLSVLPSTIIQRCLLLLFLLTVLSIDSVALEAKDGIRAFDFGASTPHIGWARSAENFLAVGGQVYESNVGYGWNNEVTAIDFGLIRFNYYPEDPLLRDGVCGGKRQGTFKVDLRNGKYKVMLLTGGPNARRMEVWAQNRKLGFISYEPWDYRMRSYEVEVANGQMNLEFRTIDKTGWTVNGLVIEALTNIKQESLAVKKMASYADVLYDDSGKDEGVEISYSISEPGLTTIGIFDKNEKLIRQLILGEEKSVGTHIDFWNFRDDSGLVVEPGQYQFRGATSNIKAVWKETLGNTGTPPWGETKIRGGIFNVIEALGNDIIVGNPLGEGAGHFQRLDHSGQPLWSLASEPGHGEETAMTADDNFVYIVTQSDTDRDNSGNVLFKDKLWRVSSKTGRLVPWSEDKPQIELNKEYRYGVGRWSKYEIRQDRYENFKHAYEVCDIEVFAGKLFIPLRSKGKIDIYSAETGSFLNSIEGFNKCQGIDIDRHGNLYVASGQKIFHCDISSGLIKPVVAESLDAPWDVELDEIGNIYVSDHGKNQQIKKFDSSGKLIRSFGVVGGGHIKDGRLDRLFFPLGITIDGSNRLVVADYGNGRLVYYNQQGQIVNQVAAHGYGGNNGGVSYLPGNTQWLYTGTSPMQESGWMVNAKLYRTGLHGKPWQVFRRWTDISPVCSTEPVVAKTLPNGQTYMFFLSHYPTVYKVGKDGQLIFCVAMLHPKTFGMRDRGLRVESLVRPEIGEDAQKLGLVKDGVFRRRIMWLDYNHDLRIQKNEIDIQEDETLGFYSCTDGWVDDEGNIYMGDLSTGTFWKFTILGFHDKDIPIYSWSKVEKLWDAKEHSEFYGNGWNFYGKRVDDKDNIYFTMMKGPGCSPADVRIVKYSSDGKMLWKVGRKARGLKDKPGEFMSAPGFLGIVDGVVYILEYEGKVDTYTDDGLYLATLLNSGHTGKVGPYSNWGENFFGSVVKDNVTKKTYVTVNTHNYCLPVFEVVGLDRIMRFSGQIEVTAEQLTKMDIKEVNDHEKNIEDPAIRKIAKMYESKMPFVVDGDITEWQGVIPDRSVIEDSEDTYYVESYAVFNDRCLYLAYHVGDPTPARNKSEGLTTLWEGDAIEIYISEVAESVSEWTPKHKIVHIGVSEDSSKQRLALLERRTGQWRSLDNAEIAVRKWSNHRGYDVELMVPWEAIGFSSHKTGDLLAWDWKVVYGNPQDKFGFKLGFSGNERGLHPQTPLSWELIRLVSADNESDRTINAYKLPKDIRIDCDFSEFIDIVPQAELAVQDAEQMYNCALSVGYTHDAICFAFDVRDPDPAINTATSTYWWSSGDYIELSIAGKKINLSAVPTNDKVLLINGQRPRNMQGAKLKVKIDSDGLGYKMEVAIPWVSLNAELPKEDVVKMEFDWMMSWSDKSGGSLFTQIQWAAPAKKGWIVFEPESSINTRKN